MTKEEMAGKYCPYAIPAGGKKCITSKCLAYKEKVSYTHGEKNVNDEFCYCILIDGDL